jgi:broad specificity phosphatase PhoE
VNRLILIRHGQSEHHIRGLTGGWTDTPLTPLGRAQAQAAAERCRQFVASEPSLFLYSSDLLRASQTAEYVARALGRECQPTPALREINNGLAVGLTWEEAKKIELPPTEPHWYWLPYPQAESWSMLTERVFVGMEAIARACPSTAVVIAHGFSGVAVIQWWLRLDEHLCQKISFELDAASVTELGIGVRQERTIVRLNDTAHLQAHSLP